MSKAISNTSPLLYLHRIGVLNWLPSLFTEVWIPKGVVVELKEGQQQQQRGYDVTNPIDHNWLRVVEPQMVPSEWLSLDLGTGELEAMALALENRRHVIVNHLEDVSMWISDEIKERVLILASEERE